MRDPMVNHHTSHLSPLPGPELAPLPTSVASSRHQTGSVAGLRRADPSTALDERAAIQLLA